MDAGLNAFVQHARKNAHRRRHRPSTAHLLLALYQEGPDTGSILMRCGVRETDLLEVLARVDDEPSGAIELALEKALKLARRQGGPATPVHLLAILSRDARSAAHRALEKIGVGARAVREASMTELGLEGTERRTASPAARPEPTAPRRGGAEPPRARLPGLAPSPGARTPTRPRRIPLGLPHEEPTSRKPLDPRPRRTAERRRPDTPGASRPAPPRARRGKARPGAAPPPNVRREEAARRAPAPTLPLSAHELDPDRYPLLCALGRNLTALAADGLIDPVVGREREVELVLDVLARRRANNPLLVGPPGVGKTAIAEGLALRMAGGGGGLAGLEGRVLVELTAGSLVSGTGVRGAVADRVRQLRTEVQRSAGEVILFIDEIHAIVGGSEGPDDLAHELKAALARGELPCVGATTDAEYRKHFERDAALARRFSAVRIEEPSEADAIEILRGVASRYEAHHAVRYAADAIEAAVELSVRFMPERRLPDKAIGVIDLAAARVRRRGGKSVDRDAVASVVAERARVPVERLTMRDSDKLLELEALLAERVVGHAGPLARIADALRKGAAGFRGRRPLGTFLLLGPTGVGKTETAKAVSDVFFPAGGITRLDLSECSEAHSVARLLGAPPGYVGHDDGGQLTEAVRRRPYQLVLLDEIDKAHPDVLLSLLPLLDEGRLTDGRGRTVDFTNTIVFMTSNHGAGEASSGPRIGFAADDDAGAGEPRWMAAARRALPPELWNRIDEPLFFAPLSAREVATIAGRMLDRVAATLHAEHGVALSYDDSAVEALVAAGGYDPALGARPMRRVIGRMVESALASRVLAGDVGAGDAVRLTGRGAEIHFVVGSGAEAAE